MNNTYSKYTCCYNIYCMHKANFSNISTKYSPSSTWRSSVLYQLYCAVCFIWTPHQYLVRTIDLSHVSSKLYNIMLYLVYLVTGGKQNFFYSRLALNQHIQKHKFDWFDVTRELPECTLANSMVQKWHKRPSCTISGYQLDLVLHDMHWLHM